MVSCDIETVIEVESETGVFALCLLPIEPINIFQGEQGAKILASTNHEGTKLKTKTYHFHERPGRTTTGGECPYGHFLSSHYHRSCDYNFLALSLYVLQASLPSSRYEKGSFRSRVLAGKLHIGQKQWPQQQIRSSIASFSMFAPRLGCARETNI